MDDHWFSQWLRREMEDQELTRKQLAEKSGISIATIGYYLNAERLPTLFTFGALVNALGKRIEIIDDRKTRG